MQEKWLHKYHDIPADFHNARLHEFVVMPNHIHGIIEIVPVGADSISACPCHAESQTGQPQGAYLGYTQMIPHHHYQI